MKKFEQYIAAATLASTLVAGCSSPEQPAPAPMTRSAEPTTPDAGSGLTFLEQPETGFSVGDCKGDVNGWAVYIDSSPEDAIDPLYDTFTIGLADRHKSDGKPIFVAGATIRRVHNANTYEIATSADALGEHPKPVVVNLGKELFSRILDGGDGYDAVLSAHKSEDGSVYFGLKCLADFEYNGDQTPERLVNPPPAKPTPRVEIV